MYRIYWDACVFLRYINGDPAVLPTLDALIEQSEETSDVQIYTSTFSITEVAFAVDERNNKFLNPASERIIDDLWNNRDAIQLIEFFEDLAKSARTYIRSTIENDSTSTLRPADAVHLASAKFVDVHEFQTYDKKLIDIALAFGMNAQEPVTPQPKLIP